MAATVVEIARACGVSKGTAANILSGHGGYAEATRKRVLRVAGEMGFSPGRLGRSLRQRSTSIVTLLVGASLEDPFNAELLQGLSTALHPLDVDTLVRLDRWETADGLRASYRAALSWRPRAVVALGPSTFQREIAPAERVAWLSQAAIVHVHDDPWVEGSAVDVDRAAMAKLGIGHLASRGHKRIAVLNFSAQTTHFKYRLTVEALRSAGLRFQRQDLIHGETPTADDAGDARTQRMYDAGRSFAATRGKGPTAIFSWSDTLAAPFVAGFCNSGGRVPEDLGVVVVSESRLLARLSVPLTSVGVEIQRTTQAVADVVKSVWQGGTTKPVHVRLAPTLIERGSA